MPFSQEYIKRFSGKWQIIIGLMDPPVYRACKHDDHGEYYAWNKWCKTREEAIKTIPVGEELVE